MCVWGCSLESHSHKLHIYLLRGWKRSVCLCLRDVHVFFMTCSVVSRLVLCETWLQTKSRLIKRVCVPGLEADWESGDRLVCVFAVRSENELNDPQPTRLLTSVCGGRPVSPACTPPHAVLYCITVCVHFRIICQAGM